MATLVEKTIGTGGDYATWADFLVACPASLVALDQQWRVKFKKQVFTLASSTVAFDFSTARTTSATCYFEFTADTGAAWCDDVNIRTLPFAYDSARGATLVNTGSGAVFVNNVAYTRINRLQFVSTSTSSTAQPAIQMKSTALNCDVNQCIFDAATRNTSLKGVVNVSGSTNYLRNSLVIQRAADAAALIAQFGTSAKVINVTLVSLNTKLTTGIDTGSGAAPDFRNVAMFNATGAETGTNAATKTNCYTDAAGTGWNTAPYSAATFESITAGSPDFRLKAGAVLIDAGAVEATYGTTDATGFARPSGASYDVGAWEYQAAAVADTTAPVLTGPSGTSTGTTTASGSVVTDEGNGTLYYLFTTSATANVSAVKAGSSQAVGAPGQRNVTAAGLSPSTTYYVHFVHTDAANNDSAVSTSPSFTTAAAGDATAPVLEAATGTSTGATTAIGTVATDEAGGLLYYLASTNASETDAAIKAGVSQSVDATGTQNVTVAGLNASTTYRIHFVQVDASGNQSNVISSAQFTTGAPAAGTITTPQLVNAMGNPYVNLAGLAVNVLNATTLAQVLLLSGETTDGGGLCTFSHASLTPGTDYALAIRIGSGLYGIDKVTAV